MKTLTATQRRVVAAIAGVTAAVAATGCSVAGKSVCSEGPLVVNLVAMSSHSDMDLARELTPKLRPHIAAMAARSCATLKTAVATNNPNDLTLHATRLVPKRDKVPNPDTETRKLAEAGEAVIDEQLISTLEKTPSTAGSPVLRTLKRIAEELRNTESPPGCTVTVLVTDGYAVETVDGFQLDLYRDRLTDKQLQALVDAVAPGLEALRGGVVVLAGAAAAGPDDEAAAANVKRTIGAVLRAAGITPKFTTGTDIESRCGS